MSPGGHLVTTAVACAGTTALTGSWAATAAVAAGGFFIDLDHVADYVLLERDRPLTPDAFLRHYIEGRTRYAVLLLHSYELFALLGLAAWWTGSLWLWAYLLGATLHLAGTPRARGIRSTTRRGRAAWWTGSLWLWAYLLGATLHLALDLTFNGEITPRSIVAFYSFAYRLAHGFDARRLLGTVDFEPAPAGFWAAFFSGGRLADAPAAPSLARAWPPRVRRASACASARSTSSASRCRSSGCTTC